MAKRVSFSGQHQELAQIDIHHRDVTEALKRYFTDGNNEERFAGYSRQELAVELQCRLAEIDRTSAFSVLSAIEAAFRIDYEQRGRYRRKRDQVSKTFRTTYKEKGSKASLEEDILPVWKQDPRVATDLIRELIGAFKYRHWLAHGRYWEPKLGRRRYDYQWVYQLAQTVWGSIPFEEVGAKQTNQTNRITA